MQKSYRHHYLPQFYIKGFTNAEGLLYVYDKKKCQIIEKGKTPKQVFYEWDRNNATINGQKISFVEEFYSYIDSLFSDVIKKLREAPNEPSLLNEDITAQISFFITTLFWRTPRLDETFEEYYSRIEYLFKDKQGNKVKNIELEKTLKENELHKKLVRSGLAHKFIKETIENNSPNGGSFYAKLIEFKEDLFLLGDYPIIFKKDPSAMEDLINNEFYFPISSKRIYIVSSKEGTDLTFDMINRINTISIIQSVNFVSSPNIDFLKKAITVFTVLKDWSLLYNIKSGLF